MFFITGLPRSRTAWFSAFMTASGYPCLHEGIDGCTSIKQYKDKVKSVSDSNTAFGLIDIEVDRPILVIHRPERHNEPILNTANERLKNIEGLHVDFDDIDSRIGEIFLHLTGSEIDTGVYDKFKLLNIQSMIEINEVTARILVNESNK